MTRALNEQSININLDRKKKLSAKLNSNFLRTALLVVAFAYAPLSSFVSGALYHIPIVSSFSNYFLPLFITILIIFNIKRLFRCITVNDIIGLIILVSVILLSIVLNKKNSENVIRNMPTLVFASIPYYFVGLYWDESKEAFETIYKVSVVCIVVNFLYFVFFTSVKEFNYSMSTAYAILPSVMMCMCSYSQKKSIVALITAILGFAFLLFLGTRGPVLITIVYAAFLFYSRAQKKRRIAIIAFTAIILYVGVNRTFSSNIAKSLIDFSSKHGFSTRFFQFLYEGDVLTYTSGRDVFYEILYKKLAEQPLLGYGIYGEWEFISNPAHRIWLEIWMHYGYIFGTLLMAYMLHLIINGVKKSSNIYIRNFILIWGIHLLVRGVFGSSYLEFYSFFLWGLCNNQIRAYRKQYKSDIE